jgi:hypothetical protein
MIFMHGSANVETDRVGYPAEPGVNFAGMLLADLT